MKFTRRGIQFVSKSACGARVFACFAMLLGWCLPTGTAAPLSPENQNTGVVSGPNTRPIATPSQSATNRPVSLPGAGAFSTNGVFILDDKHKLAIGDRLSFRIVEDGDEPKALCVTDSGDIEAPYIGRVSAENKTCRQLAAEVKTGLEKEYYYQATVILAVDEMAKSHGRVYLVGAVRSPGPVEIPSDETLTLSKAILRAGGFTDYADRGHVKVTRKDAAGKEDKQTFTTDVGAIFDKGKIEADLTVEPGDLIFVPDRLIRF